MPELPWASGAVFNPGACRSDDGTIHLLFRAIPEGYRKTAKTGQDPYEGPHNFVGEYVSYIGYASSRDGVAFDVRPEPLILPDTPCDRFGAEDARVVSLDGTHYITYTALRAPAFGEEDGIGIGLASTKDFRSVAKHGLVGPLVRDKDAVLFPQRVGGKIAMLHRVVPDIQIAYFDDEEQLRNPGERYWQDYLARLDEFVVMRPEADWEGKKIGAGPTPIETPEGWLLFYHGADWQHVYRTGLVLLDRDDPTRLIARTRAPVFAPELPWEIEGDVPNVVFPQGTAVVGDTPPPLLRRRRPRTWATRRPPSRTCWPTCARRKTARGGCRRCSCARRAWRVRPTSRPRRSCPSSASTAGSLCWSPSPRTAGSRAWCSTRRPRS